MGLKCSVIGHKYGEAEIEREREEQGSEVVITIEERETCERCGKTRIVSENKEVTAIETPSEIAGDMLDDDAATADEDANTANRSAEDGPADDLEPDEQNSTTVGGHNEVNDTAADAVEPETDAMESEGDDAEILDAESSAGGDSELEDPTTAASITEPEETDPPLDAEEAAAATDPESDDGMIIDGDDGGPDEDRQPGEWPAEPEDNGDDWTPATSSVDDGEESDVEPFGGNAVTVPNGQFRCPNCEFTTDVASSSLRAGDFCPECHKGALVNTDE